VERERLKEVREKEKAEQVAERARQKADHDSRKAFQQGQLLNSCSSNNAFLTLLVLARGL
jgi:lysylphosphatidylglycerol synthetase-like protein (DUF2156 family)